MFSKKARTESSSHSRFLIRYTRSHPLSTERRRTQRRWRRNTRACQREDRTGQVGRQADTSRSRGLASPRGERCVSGPERESQLPKPTQVKQKGSADDGCSFSFAVLIRLQTDLFPLTIGSTPLCKVRTSETHPKKL